MIEDEGLMNSLGTMTFLSTRWPPPSSMCFWKLPAMQISLPGRVSGASSVTDESGLPCALEPAIRRASSRAASPSRRMWIRLWWSLPPEASLRSMTTSSPPRLTTTAERPSPSEPWYVARRMVRSLLS